MAAIIKSVFGSSTPETKPSGTDTILKLCDRVTSSTLLDDRRDALRAIKGMSREYRKEVAEHCLGILMQAIEKDRSDSESVGYAVEAILNVLSVDEGDERTDELMLGADFASKIVTKADNISLFLGLIEEFDFQIRRPTTRLLTALLHHCLPEMQEAILTSPMGISKVMDLLADSREVIRNDALLLIMELTRSNSQIQKIVAFENAFERLMAIVNDEGMSDGTIVVQDCIIIMQNLINGNSSNQSFYREASQIQTLVPFFDFQLSSTTLWAPQKIQNILHMLRLIRMLVSPRNTTQNIAACQKVMYQCRLLALLCTFMFAGGVPTEILIESINTVGEVIRGDLTNQQYFDTVTTPSQPPRPGILTILMCMVNEKQPLQLRLAALYCFQCYLYKNEIGQAKIINTLLPSSTETSLSAGQVLCAGLFGTDSLSNWMTATALSGALNATLKPQLLRVQLSMQGKGQVTLLQQCSSVLVETADLRPLSRIGLLTLMCTWMTHCSAAVSQFLSNPVNIPFLTGMIESTYHNELDKIVGGLCASLVGICLAFNDGSISEYHPATIRQIIAHRITQETFTQSLTQISASEFFINASKQPQTLANGVNQICFDYSFTVLFKQVVDVILKALDPSYSPDSLTANSPSKEPLQPQDMQHSFEEHTSVVQQYKELLIEQDKEILRWKKKCEELEHTQSSISVSEPTLSPTPSLNNSHESNHTAEMTQLREMNTSLQRLQESLKLELAQKNAQLEKYKQDLDTARSSSGNEIELYKTQMAELRADNEALLTENNNLDGQLKALQEKFSSSVAGRADNPVDSGTQVTELQQQLKQIQLINQELTDKNSVMTKEQEDLLVLLADNDSKIKKYKNLLFSHNIQLDESEEEDSEEEEETDEDEDA